MIVPRLAAIACATASSLCLLVLLLLDCGGDVVVDSAASTSPLDAATEAGLDAAPQCSCPDAPGYAPCVKPLECCPVVGACKDPATFSCTGSAKMCP
jgi:hypothetical protein